MAHENAIHPAFPIVNPETGTLYDGLTKREYFAGLALQGAMANNALLMHFSEKGLNLTGYCVEAADSLLKELEK